MKGENVMKPKAIIEVIDISGVGHPVRLITGGIPKFPGKSQPEKMFYMRDNYDWIRTTALFEPRGYHGMMGAVLTEPTIPDAHAGLFYFDAVEYVPISGALTMGIGKALVETGIVPMEEPVTEVRLDTGVGLVKVYVAVKDGIVGESTLENDASFAYELGNTVKLPSFGEVPYDIGWGACWYAHVAAEDLGLKIELSNKDELVAAGMEVMEALKEKECVHPHIDFMTRITHMMIYEKGPRADGYQRTEVIFGNAQFDRSPCGTGTCAMLGVRHARGVQGIDDIWLTQNFIGQKFSSRLVSKTKVGQYEAVVPQITGTAFIYGMGKLIVDQDDPLQHGWAADRPDLIGQ